MGERRCGLNSPQNGLGWTQYRSGLWKHRPQGRTNGAGWLCATPGASRGTRMCNINREAERAARAVAIRERLDRFFNRAVTHEPLHLD